ncbi:MAG: GerMN domain-containing protein [Actinomycetota bacterium]
MRLSALASMTLLLVVACRSEGLTLLPDADLPRDVYGSPGPTPVETSELPEDGIVYLVRGERLQPRPRTLQPISDSLPEALILALISPLREGGRVTTAIPGDTRLNEVRVEGRVATVDLSSEFEGAAPGEVQTLRIAQVVFTLTHEGTGITAVKIAIDGIPQQLVVTDRPVTRTDYLRFAPPDEGQP